MLIEEGCIVRSTAGRDKLRFMVVVAITGDRCFLCDGAERPLERPKCKNPKHLSLTGRRLPQSSMVSNREIRRALNEFVRRGEA